MVVGHEAYRNLIRPHFRTCVSDIPVRNDIAMAETKRAAGGLGQPMGSAYSFRGRQGLVAQTPSKRRGDREVLESSQPLSMGDATKILTVRVLSLPTSNAARRMVI